MATGEHKPTKAQNRCWKDCIGILLDEVMTALEESFVGLSAGSPAGLRDASKETRDGIRRGQGRPRDRGAVV